MDSGCRNEVFVRSVQSYSLLGEKRNEETGQELGIQSLNKIVKGCSRSWCENFNRMSLKGLPISGLLIYWKERRRYTGDGCRKLYRNRATEMTIVVGYNVT